MNLMNEMNELIGFSELNERIGFCCIIGVWFHGMICHGEFLRLSNYLPRYSKSSKFLTFAMIFLQ